MEISTKNIIFSCQQEYSSRQAGITTGIVLACLVPILLLIVFVGFRVLKKQKEEREHEAELNSSRNAEMIRLSKLKEDDDLPWSPSKATEIN
ncbi:unnamed protein product [Xylocopa violacea]|uniref:Uncharacterized protein n=1 Tax=Xylocopa violacea TaxID=135666 RepID=A0ABP1NY83_XYLVO